MTKKSTARLMILCAALAACSNTETNRAVTAPDDSPALNAVPAEMQGSATFDGPSDLSFSAGGASVLMAAAAPNAASGGRASGHATLSFNPPFLGLVTQEYSFVALRTDPLIPFAAKGEYDMVLTTATGAVQEVHGNVICMSTVGNTTNIAGIITSVVVNGIPRPLSTAQSHNAWTVTDNGEGKGITDTVSIMPFFPLGGALFHCNSGWIIPTFSNQAGNIQVKP